MRTNALGCVIVILSGLLAEAQGQGRASAQSDYPLLGNGATRNNSITEGTAISIAQAPWQVALIRGYFRDPTRLLFCGGSLIKPGWVLTAAHCVPEGTSEHAVDVVAGTDHFADVGVPRVQVLKIFRHEDWDPESYASDVALLQLSAPLTSNLTVPLPNFNAALPVGNISVSGWGATMEHGSSSDQLMMVSVPITRVTACNAAYPGKIAPGMFCAGLLQGGRDSCQGDSGGPAVSASGTLVGLVSWGDGCGRRNRYGVYTAVARYRGWIDDVLKANN